MPSLNVRDQVSHQYRTNRILFTFLPDDRKRTGFRNLVFPYVNRHKKVNLQRKELQIFIERTETVDLSAISGEERKYVAREAQKKNELPFGTDRSKKKLALSTSEK
jgi:hypothetical protein